MIAQFFVASRDEKGGADDLVLDPFCGSGTVALEASVDGATPLICDANPFAALLTAVKTTPYKPEELLKGLDLIVSRKSSGKGVDFVDIVNWQLWYSARVKSELDAISSKITQIDEQSIRDFFRICFASAARRLSNADPLISVPVRQKERDRHSSSVNERIRARQHWLAHASAMEEFKRVCIDNIRRVTATNQAAPHRKPAILVSRDAKNLASVRDAGMKVPLIVTSPPYGSAQKYIRASSLALNWLGLASPRELAVLESKSIGREHVSRSKELVCNRPIGDDFSEFVQGVRRVNSKRARITELYLDEMHASLSEMSDTLSDDGCAVIVIGNNQVCGSPLRNDDFVRQVLVSAGLELEMSLRDSIKSRGLMTKRNKTASIITTESILVFRKKT